MRNCRTRRNDRLKDEIVAMMCGLQAATMNSSTPSMRWCPPASDECHSHDEGIELQIIKLPEAKKGFVLLPRRWVVERSFGWLNRFRRLARDYERLPETLAGLHFVVFAMLMLVHVAPAVQVPNTL
jgi:transposase